MRRLFYLIVFFVPAFAHASFFIDRPESPAKPTSRIEIEPIHKIDIAPINNPLLDIKPVERWQIKRGERISDAFSRWSKKTKKWQLVWEAPELVAQTDVTITGDFETSVAQVIEALNKSNAGLLHRFYTGNSVLRIWEKK